MGFLNLYVVYNFDTETWVNFKLFGIIGLTLAFIVAQSFYIGRHLRQDADGGEK
jgi:intracellular septation protein